MLKMAANTESACEILGILRSILLQTFTFLKFDSNKGLPSSQFGETHFLNTKDYMWNFHWMWNDNDFF